MDSKMDSNPQDSFIIPTRSQAEVFTNPAPAEAGSMDDERGSALEGLPVFLNENPMDISEKELRSPAPDNSAEVNAEPEMNSEPPEGNSQSDRATAQTEEVKTQSKEANAQPAENIAQHPEVSAQQGESATQPEAAYAQPGDDSAEAVLPKESIAQPAEIISQSQEANAQLEGVNAEPEEVNAQPEEFISPSKTVTVNAGEVDATPEKTNVRPEASPLAAVDDDVPMTPRTPTIVPVKATPEEAEFVTKGPSEKQEWPKTEGTVIMKKREGNFVTRVFATVKDAEASIKLPPEPTAEQEPEPAGEQQPEPAAEQQPEPVAEVPKRRSGRASGSRTSTRSSGKRVRSAALAISPAHDDDDTEMSEGPSQHRPPPKKKARVSEGSTRLSSSAPLAIELSSRDLPAGWIDPLVYFATTSSESAWGKQWKSLPERRVCNGAIWLSANCTGTPDVANHVEGPTAILRDLVSMIQSHQDTTKLHENNYTSLPRANARTNVHPNKITTEFCLTRTLKSLTEKDYLQRLPLDLICNLLVDQLRIMTSRSQKFPSHLFTTDLHLYQYAPTIAFHLLGAGIPFALSDLLAAFADESTKTIIQRLGEEHKKNSGTRMLGSRRRGEGAASATASFIMSDEISAQVLALLTNVHTNLDKIRSVKFGPQLITGNPLRGKTFTENEFIVSNIPVRLVPRSAAALRDRTYDFYDIPSFIILSDIDHVQEEDQSNYAQAVNLHIKEDSHWLDSVSTQYLDLTLTEEQEIWLVSNERLFNGSRPPPAEPERNVLHYLVSHTSSIAPNAKIVVSLKVNAAEDKMDKIQARNKAFVSVQAARDIKCDEPVTLDTTFKKVTWAELADDTSQNTDMGTQGKLER